MKSIVFIIIFVLVLGLVAICSIVKFATELHESDARAAEGMLPDDLVVRVSNLKSMGVVGLSDNHSCVASERFPYLAAIIAEGSKKRSFSCFGCLVQQRWVVTAAHCKRPGHSHHILLYSDLLRNHTKTYPLILWKVHEMYNPNATSPKYDIAVAKIGADLKGTASRTAVFTNQGAKQVQASIWKTVMTMDRTTYLTNDLDVYHVHLTYPTKCFERYGIPLDNSLLCVDLSKRQDCFVTEFGPLFAFDSHRIVGVLTKKKPPDCDTKVAIFTNVSAYSNWIKRVTEMGNDSRSVRKTEKEVPVIKRNSLMPFVLLS